MPQQHTVVMTVEASGTVTPAPQPDAAEATDVKEPTDG
jgi:hypothetical protein